MPIPTCDQLIFPLLQVQAERPEGLKSHDAHEAVADLISLTEDDKKTLLPSGRQQVYRNRIGWAHDRLKRAKLSQSIQRVLWQLNQAGIDFYKENRNGLSDEQLKQFRDFLRSDGFRQSCFG
jgi:restriction system protein